MCPSEVVKQMGSLLALYVRSIIKSSFLAGIIPECLKQVLVVPVLKKPSLDPEVFGITALYQLVLFGETCGKSRLSPMTEVCAVQCTSG